MTRIFYMAGGIVTLLIWVQLTQVGSDLQAQTTPTSGTVTYRYDSVGRLVQDVYPQNSGAYNYDKAGNRISATRS